jgi:hypothetical protein
MGSNFRIRRSPLKLLENDLQIVERNIDSSINEIKLLRDRIADEEAGVADYSQQAEELRKAIARLKEVRAAGAGLMVFPVTSFGVKGEWIRPTGFYDSRVIIRRNAMKDWKQRSDDDAGKFNDEKFENGGKLDPASAQRWGDRARDLKAEAEQEVIAQRDARDEAERLLRAAQAAVDTYGRLRQEATRMVRASAMTAGERAGYV